jgi:hypothetical protein
MPTILHKHASPQPWVYKLNEGIGYYVVFIGGLARNPSMYVSHQNGSFHKYFHSSFLEYVIQKKRLPMLLVKTNSLAIANELATCLPHGTRYLQLKINKLSTPEEV